MKYIRKDLLTLLISLFILAGCENPSGIGLEVSPEDQIDAMLTDTVSLQTFTLKDDSAQSVDFNQNVFGLFRDPVFGTTRVGLALDMGRPLTVRRIRHNADIDSIILVLPFGREYFGDTTLTTPFTIQVRQLDEAYTFAAFSTKKWQVRDRVIGSVTLNRYPYKQTDSLVIVKHISGKDSTIKVAPQLRIPLDKEFFRELLGFSSDPATLATITGFRNHVKGLYLSVDEGSSTGIGGLVNFTAVTDVSGIEMTYRQLKGENVEETELDTTRTLLPITPYSIGAGTSLGLASSVETQYTEQVLEQLQNPASGHVSVYLHAPVGLRGKIVFPHLDQLKGKGLSINKAELVMYVDQERMAGPFNQPAPRLTLYREDVAGQRQNIPDGSAIGSSGYPLDSRSWNYLDFGGWYSGSAKRYVFYLTSYIQDVLNGKINGNTLYIAPVSVNDLYIPLSPALNAGSRVVLGGSDHPQYKMKLNLYYTETSR